MAAADAPELVLPRVAAYLGPLPEGAASHPQCVAKAALLRRALADRPLDRIHVAALPRPIGRIVTCPPRHGEWVPDVWLAAILMAIADAYAMDDDAYLAWLGGLNAGMFNGIFRLLMRLASPELILRGASERWTVFHRGSALELVDVGDRRCTARLTFPPRLFHGLTLRQFEPVFEAALRIPDPSGRVVLVGADDTSGLFAASWSR